MPWRVGVRAAAELFPHASVKNVHVKPHVNSDLLHMNNALHASRETDIVRFAGDDPRKAPMQRSASIHIPSVILTAHARQRLAQRNLTVQSLAEVESFGRRGPYQPGGAEAWRVDRGVVRACRRDRPWIADLLGVTLVNGADGVCVTAYRNRKCQRLLRKAVRPGRGRHGYDKAVKQ